jgi:hypothetical protein
VQIIELYTGNDQKTHVRDYTPEEFADLACRVAGPVYVPPPNSGPNRPGGFFVDWHPFDMAVLYVMCTGVSEYETEEGWRRLMPGDIVIFSDATGKGHRFHVKGLESRIALGATWNKSASAV